MTDRPTSGPAPRWGEYAPAPPEQPAPPAAVESQHAPVAEPAPVGQPAPAPADRTAPPTGRAARRAPTWDRVLTIGLLVLGLLNVLSGIPQFLRLPQTLDAAYNAQGIGDYTATGLATAIGIAINAVNVVLLLVAVALAVARLRAGKLAFWVPLAAGATAAIVTIALLAVAMLGDPSLTAYLQQGGTGS